MTLVHAEKYLRELRAASPSYMRAVIAKGYTPRQAWKLARAISKYRKEMRAPRLFAALDGAYTMDEPYWTEVDRLSVQLYDEMQHLLELARTRPNRKGRKQ